MRDFEYHQDKKSEVPRPRSVRQVYLASAGNVEKDENVGWRKMSWLRTAMYKICIAMMICNHPWDNNLKKKNICH